MLLAQLHRKVPSEFEGMEDVLTSSIVGLFKYLPEKEALELLAQSFDISQPKGPIEIEMWPSCKTPEGFRDYSDENYSITEPDVIIRTRDWLILIEAKFMSRLDDAYDQLGREYVVGYQLADEEKRGFRLCVLTADTFEPMPGGWPLSVGLHKALDQIALKNPNISEMISSIDNSLYWCNWQSLYGILSSARDITVDHGDTDALLQDVCDLLELRGLKPVDFRRLHRILEDLKEAEKTGSVWSFPSMNLFTTTASLSAGWKRLTGFDLDILREIYLTTVTSRWQRLLDTNLEILRPTKLGLSGIPTIGRER